MTQLSDTQALILSAAAQRPERIALPLPESLRGGAAAKVVAAMIAKDLLQEVNANLRKGEPIWRETGDGHGTTLDVTDAGLRAIGIEPVVVKTMTAIHKHAAEPPSPKPPTPRPGTKQAMLISLLQAPEGATIEAMITATCWKPHTLRGAMSGALGKKLGLIVTSAKEGDGARVYRISPGLA